MKTQIEVILKSRYKGKQLSIKNESLLVSKIARRLFLFLKEQSTFFEFWKDEERIRKSIRLLYRSGIAKTELKHHKKLCSKTFSRIELKRLKTKLIEDLFDFLRLDCSNNSHRCNAHYVAKILIASHIRTGPLKRVEDYLQLNFRPSQKS